ncbi:MAG: hypothetical protein ACFCU9_04405 [Cyanophyceae cyanobacterium]
MKILPLLILLSGTAYEAVQANPYQTRIQLLEQQILLLQSQQDQLVSRREVERLQRQSKAIPDEWIRLEIQILQLRADIEAEGLREQQQLQQQADRQQQLQQRSEQQAQQQAAQQLRNSQTLRNDQALLTLQEEELARLEAEHRQTEAAYPFGLIPESQWQTLQRRRQGQRERIQLIRNRIQGIQSEL